MADLDGSSIPVDLGAGVTLVAPGLLGTAERAPELLGGRAYEQPPAMPAITDGLAAAGLEQVHGVQIAATEVPTVGLDMRGPHDEGLLVLHGRGQGHRCRRYRSGQEGDGQSQVAVWCGSLLQRPALSGSAHRQVLFW